MNICQPKTVKVPACVCWHAHAVLPMGGCMQLLSSLFCKALCQSVWPGGGRMRLNAESTVSRTINIRSGQCSGSSRTHAHQPATLCPCTATRCSLAPGSVNDITTGCFKNMKTRHPALAQHSCLEMPTCCRADTGVTAPGGMQPSFTYSSSACICSLSC